MSRSPRPWQRLGALLAITATLAACSDANPPARPADAYVWGFPLIVTMRTLQTFALALPVNALTWQGALSDTRSRTIVAPNTDTLYAVSPIDLRGEPLALTVPEIRDRYYSFQMISAYSDTFAYVGTRATGARAGTWVITPPGWSGRLPAGVTRIEAPTPQMFLLGRFAVDGPAQVPDVLALRSSVVLQGLSGFTGEPPAPRPFTGFGPPRGTPQDVASAGIGFFDELGDALSVNPPPGGEQQRMLDGFASLGVGPGRHPSEEQTDPALLAALAEGVEEGEAEVVRSADSSSGRTVAWNFRTDLGAYGDDSLLRATVAKIGWGANVAEEALYARTQHDADGAVYSGEHAYVLHFTANEIPPVDAFWSLTLYGPDLFFVANPIDRYAIGSHTPGLRFNVDGSLDILVQHAPPLGRESNWLPAPAGEFLLMMRLYLPRAAALDGSWVAPPVRRAANDVSS